MTGLVLMGSESGVYLTDMLNWCGHLPAPKVIFWL